MSLIEMTGICIGYCLRIESRIRDFIVLGKDRSLIQKIGTPEGREVFLISRGAEIKNNFTQKTVVEFLDLFEGDIKFIWHAENIDEIRDGLMEIVEFRDLLCHASISLHNDRIFHMPSAIRRSGRMQTLGITDNSTQIPLSGPIDQDFLAEMRKTFENYDTQFFPKLSNQIGLDYQKIR